MDITIRKATKEDLPTLNVFLQKLVNVERPFDDGIPPTGDVIYYNLANMLDDEKTHLIVAEADGTVVGSGYAQIRKNDADWALNKQYGYIGFMFVDDTYRHNNIGKHLTDALIKWLKEKKMQDIQLKVYAKNEKAIAAYKKYGFEEFVSEMKLKAG